MWGTLRQLGTGFGTLTPAAADYMQGDISEYLTNQGEILTVFRDVETYTSGKPVHSWNCVGTIVGDWQAVTGKVIRMEASMEVKSDALVITTINVDVLENDKIQRGDGFFMYVNYIKKYVDHWTIYLKKNKR